MNVTWNISVDDYKISNYHITLFEEGVPSNNFSVLYKSHIYYYAFNFTDSVPGQAYEVEIQSISSSNSSALSKTMSKISKSNQIRTSMIAIYLEYIFL